ncbi:MAG TPA: hypothetical protein VH420_06005 [Gaiellaceae bacterium]
MTTFLVVNVVVLWAFVVFQGLVLLEAVRQISQIRRELDFDDKPVPVSVGALAGKPIPDPVRAAWSENGTAGDGVVLLLSSDCSTCRAVASGLRDLVAQFDRLRIVTILQARNHDEVTDMLADAGLARDEVTVDLEGEYGAAVGIATRPAAVVIRQGIISEGAVVRNARQLQQLLDTLEAPTGDDAPTADTPVSTPT